MGKRLLILNLGTGEDWAGLEIGGRILEEEEEEKLPLTSCSNDPRIESELPSEFPSLVSDLLPTLLSLLPLCEEAVSMLGAFRNLGLPTHCWMCGIKMSMGIFSSHLSHISFPDSMISLALTGDLFPATSCLALSSSSSFFTGRDFFLSLDC